jgi:hypothetical protein
MPDSTSDRAQVLEAAGLRDEAIAAWRQGLDCSERKEIIRPRPPRPRTARRDPGLVRRGARCSRLASVAID